MDIHKNAFFCVHVNVFRSAMAQLVVVMYAWFWFAAGYGSISIGFLGKDPKEKKKV